MKHVKVLYHGRCLDGMASAATFTRFYRDCVDPDVRFSYQAMLHGGSPTLEDEVFTGDVNAVVDFRYSPDPRLHWWFDHHRSAFVTPDDRAHFEQREGPRFRWDPAAPSCTGYIARVAAADHGFDPESVSELVRWLDIIDAARFESAEDAVALEKPAYQLMAVCGQVTDAAFATRIIDGLVGGDIEAVAALPEVQEAFAPIKADQDAGLALVRENLTRTADVAVVDLLDHDGASFNKFAPYALEPEVTYVVVVHHFDGRVKYSVGANPWRTEARRHDISNICEQFGGGGHAVVGGISLADLTLDHARRITGDIVEQLLTDPMEGEPA